MSDTPATYLVLEVCLHEGRYHGVPDWPPSPARVFQALVAGAAKGAIDPEDLKLLSWLEEQDAPVIGAPVASHGKEVKLWVPNNDLDRKGGDPAKTAEIRTAKQVRPWIFEGDTPLLYVWRAQSAVADLEQRFRALAARLYQLGRGVDMAWGRARVASEDEVAAVWEAYAGARYEPAPGASGSRLDCPARGTLASLQHRFAALGRRFEMAKQGRKAVTVFVQAPKPRFLPVAYDVRPERRLYELRPDGGMGKLSVRRLTEAYAFTLAVRDAAATRLAEAVPSMKEAVERTLIGREAGGRPAAAAERRIRIIPIPSIGHEHVDRGIRRVLVEVPAAAEIPSADVFWAFSGLAASGETVGEAITLVEADDTGMLRHYGVEALPSRMWRTVTPAALPESTRRRIDPGRIAEEAKGAAERASEEARARSAVRQALRHAGVRSEPAVIRVQREPFEAKGARAEAFENKPRFGKERLWQVEIEFEGPVTGPLVIGDGRFLGLGLMRPASPSGVIAFKVVDGLQGRPDPAKVVHAFRRAMFARVQAHLGSKAKLPRYISGHGEDGRPSEGHDHISLAFDPGENRLLLFPAGVPGRGDDDGRRDRHHQLLDAALAGFQVLRAGAAGKLRLTPAPIDRDADRLFKAGRRWVSVTRYRVTRHVRVTSAQAGLVEDLRLECVRSGLPEPRIEVIETHGVPGVGLEGLAELFFATAVSGPILLGRSKHQGGGLFEAR